jgi:hypothetical protein
VAPSTLPLIVALTEWMKKENGGKINQYVKLDVSSMLIRVAPRLLASELNSFTTFSISANKLYGA